MALPFGTYSGAVAGVPVTYAGGGVAAAPVPFGSGAFTYAGGAPVIQTVAAAPVMQTFAAQPIYQQVPVGVPSMEPTVRAVTREEMIASGRLRVAGEAVQRAAPAPQAAPVVQTAAVEVAAVDPEPLGSIDAWAEVAQGWEAVHGVLPEPSSRVPRQVFVDYCMNFCPTDPNLQESFVTYVNALFDTGTALMLPAQKEDLGKHCFGYASLLAGEYYGPQPQDRLCLNQQEKPNDIYAEIRANLDEDWALVEKDEAGRVNINAFINVFFSKFNDLLIQETAPYYQQFLEQVFNTSLTMMLPAQKDTLGGHCFRYGALLAGEFYFDAAKDAVAGCGCQSPVLDVLGITQQPAQ